MATIRVKRSTGSTAPTGLTFGEPAFVDGTNSLYVTKNNATSLRVGAEVDTNTALGTSDNKIPTQLAVKTYVDNNVASGAVASLNGLTGAVFIGAGTAISLSAAGKGITVTNTGVQSIAGTSNQITASGSTGAVTLSLPSALTVPGSLTVTTDLTVTGNLTINGTTTTVNADTMTIDDPMITLGLSGGLPISVSDGGKDRGVAFTYYNATGKTGFFGWDASATQFIFASDAAIASDVATVNSFAPIQASSAKLYNAVNGGNGILIPTTLTTDRTYTLPDYTGTVMVPSSEGTLGQILRSSGTPNQPVWISPNSAGFTAFTSTNVITTADAADTLAYVAFVNAGTDSNQGIRYNTGLTYNASTNALSATTFIGALSGNATTATTATTATNATNVAMLSDTADTLAFVAFVNAATDTNQAVKYNSGLTYNAVTNSLSATTFVGAHIGNSSTATALQTARTIGLTGDISGSASFDGTANINISATIEPNSVALGTDTTGNYVATLSTTAGAGLTISGSGAESAAVTVNLSKITSGIDFGNFAFTTGEFTNSSGTVAIGTVDGGSF